MDYHETRNVFSLMLYQKIRECIRKKKENPLKTLLETSKIFEVEQMPLIISAMDPEQVDVMIGLLKFGCDPNAISPHTSDFPLIAAARSKNIIGVQILLSAGANPNQTNPITEESALSITFSTGNIEIAKILIKAGVDPKQVDPKDGNFLLLAVRRGDSSFVKELLKAGLNPNQVELVTEEFPLLNACRSKYLDITEELLKSGANPNQISNKQGTAPLLEATWNYEIASLLLCHGADPNITVGKSGNFPLNMCSRSCDAKTVNLFLKKGANPNQCHSQTGSFPLLMAAKGGYNGTIQVLLKYGADPDQVNRKTGGTALNRASKKCSPKVVRSLLESGADPNMTNPITKNFPLYVACQHNQHQNVQEFMKHNERCRQKILLLCCARELLSDSKSEIAECLVDNDCFPYDMFKMLMESIPMVNLDQVHAKTQKTAYEIAQECGRTKIMMLFVD